MYKHLLTAAIVASIGLSPAYAQGASTGDSSIAHMVSGGAWAAGTRQGVYRLIVSNFGSEHVVSTARVDWVVTPARDSVSRTIATAALPIPAQQYSLGAPELYSNFDGWNAHVCGTQAYDGSQHAGGYGWDPQASYGRSLISERAV